MSAMRILHVLHDFLPRHVGGVEVYVERISRAQASEHAVALLFAEARDGGDATPLRREIREGRRLYESCIVSYGSNLRTGHGLQSLPALLSGGGAGRIRHGRHVVLPKENTSLANYWLTLLQQAGVETPRFHYGTEVVSELLG